MQRPFAPWRGFSMQLFMVTILPLTVLLVVVAFVSQAFHHDAMRSLVGERDLRTVRAAASVLEKELAHRQTVLQMLARGENWPPDLTQAVRTQPETSMAFDLGIAAVAADGNLISSSNPDFDWTGLLEALDSSTAEDGLLQKDGLVAAGLQVSGPQGSRLMGAYDPRRLIDAALAGLVDPQQETIQVFASSLTTASGGSLLFAVGPNAGEDLMTNYREAFAGAQNSGTHFHMVHGSERVMTYSRVGATGWVLVLDEDWESIAGPSLRSTQIAPLALAPALVLALVGLWFGARRVIQPLGELEQQTEALARGDFEAIHKPVGGIPEIQTLQRTLIDMVTKLQAAQRNLRGYIGAITAGIENERRTLARDLHDDTIQSLIALNQRVQLASMRENDSDTKARMVELQGMLQQTIANLRRMIRGLRPIYMEDLGLKTALEMLVEEMRSLSNADLRFSALGEEFRLSIDQEMALYRIAQEGLNNIIRHSQASRAELQLEFTPKQLLLRLRDDGIGFTVPENAASFAAQNHFGLLGMIERAEILHARLHIDSSPGQGTSIQLSLPR